MFGYRIIENDKEAKMMGEETGQNLQSIEFYKRKILEDIDEESIPATFYFLITGQLVEIPSQKVINKINSYARKHPENRNVWEINHNGIETEI